MSRRKKHRNRIPDEVISEEKARAMITGFIAEDGEISDLSDFFNPGDRWARLDNVDFEGDTYDYAFDFNPDGPALMARRHGDNFIEVIPTVALHRLYPELYSLYREVELKQKSQLREKRYAQN